MNQQTHDTASQSQEPESGAAPASCQLLILVTMCYVLTYRVSLAMEYNGILID